MRHVVLFVLSIFLYLNPLHVWAEDERQADHEALKGLLRTTQQAINTKNFDLLAPHLAKDNFTVITVDSQKLQSLEEFKEYWNNLFSSKTAVLKRAEVNPVADGPTQFLSEDVGVCDGISHDKYYFKGGDIKPMTTRWTGVVLKEDGMWKVSKIIFSPNLFDNPVLDMAKQAADKIAIVAGLIGFVLGLFVMKIFRRRKHA